MGRAESYGACRMIFPYISMGQILDSHGYLQVIEGKVMDVRGSKKGKSWMFVGQRRESCSCIGKCASTGRTIAHVFPGFSAVYNSLSGPLSLLRKF
jgi:hypothetical protein